MTPLQVLAERESIYRLLAQTTPENLNKDYSEITLNPHSRYPNLNSQSVQPIQVRSLYDTDTVISDEHLELPTEMPKKKRKRDSIVHPDTLLIWCKKQVALYDNVTIDNLTTSWKNGLALCAIIHHYRPDLIDFHSLKEEDCAANNQLAFNICEHEFGISPTMTGQEMANCTVPDKLNMVSYINQIYDTFRGEIPHIARVAVDMSPEEKPSSPVQGRRTPASRLSLLTRINHRLSAKKQRHFAAENFDIERCTQEQFDRKTKKRRSLDKERALFILNKDQKPVLRSGLGKTVGEKVPFSDRVKTLENLLSGESATMPKNSNPGFIYHFNPLELNSRLQKSTSPMSRTSKVGRLEKEDWNIKMLEEKMKEKQNTGKKDSEGVPKWNRDCFEDKLKAMDHKLNRNLNEPGRYVDFDQQVRTLDQKLKEGTALERGMRGSNKVSAMAEQLSAILEPKQEHPPLIRSNSRPNIVNARGGSEVCHFCSKRVYLMERLSAQGKFFHRGCFKCEYCGTALRLGSYGYAADGNFGGRFLCMQHFGIPLLPPRKRPADLSISTKENLIGETPPKLLAADKVVLQPLTAQKVFLDVADSVLEKTRGATPERVEFENSILDLASEEEILSEIDEDEWTDRNFGTTTTDLDSTDEDESDFSSEEISDDDVAFEEVLQRSLTSDETRRLAADWKSRYSDANVRKSDIDGIVGTRIEIEESDEEYGESDDEFSYKVYENDALIEERSEDEENAGSASSDSEQIKKLTLGRLETLEPDEAKVVVLESDQDDSEDDSEHTEVGTDESSSDEYSESPDENSVDPLVQLNIPSVVINESPPNQVEMDEESFITSLRQQQQPLLLDSVASTPLAEEEKPIIKITPSPSYHKLDEVVSELPTPVEENKKFALEENDVKKSEDIIEVDDNRKIPLDIVENNSMGAETVLDEKEDIENGVEDSPISNVTNDLKEAIKLESSISIPEDGKNQQNDVTPVEKLSDNGNDLEDDESLNEGISNADSFDISVVTMRTKNLRNIQRDTMTKSVIEPLERPVDNEVFSSVNQHKAEVEAESMDLKPIEPASSLPNLSEANENLQTEVTPTSRKILKLKEAFLLGESNGSEQKNKNSDLKSPPTKIEPVLKSVLEMITEKQKMLSPAPSVVIPNPSTTPPYINDISPSDKLGSFSLPNSYRLNEFSLSNLIGANAVAEQKANENLDALNNGKDLERDSISPPSTNSKSSDETPVAEMLNGLDILSPTMNDMELGEKEIDTTPDAQQMILSDTEIDNFKKDEEMHDLSINEIQSAKNKECVLKNDNEVLLNGDAVLDENKNNNQVNDFDIDTSFITFRNKSKIRDIRVTSFDDSLEKFASGNKENENESSLSTLDSSDLSGIDKGENMEISVSENSEIFATPEVELCSKSCPTSSPLRYEGHFTQKIGPFVNLRDSLDIRRSATAKKQNQSNKNSSKESSICLKNMDTSDIKTPKINRQMNAKVQDKKGIQHPLYKNLQDANRRSIHEEIEEIPFADDDNNSDGAASQSKFFTPPTSVKIKPSPFVRKKKVQGTSEDVSQKDNSHTPDNQSGLKDLRQMKTVERERARQEARERARLMSDEELGLSPAVYSNMHKKGGKDDDADEIVGPLNLSEGNETYGNESSSASSNESSKTESGNYLETELSVDDAELQTPSKEKMARWSSFNVKQKPVGSVPKTKKDKRGLLSLLTNFARSESSKGKGKESGKKGSKVSSPDTDSSASDKFPRLRLSKERSKREVQESKENKKKTSSKLMDASASTRDAKGKGESVRPQRPKELVLDKKLLKHNMAEIMQPSRLLQLGAQASNAVTAPRASEDSFSESDEDEAEGEVDGAPAKRAKELTEEKLRKLQRIARRVYRQQEQKRLRMAQEIQRQLEELEVKQHELEERGVHVEKALRGEGEEMDREKEETELMQEWFLLVHEKNVLVRYEQELMVRAKELELEDRHCRLQHELREKMAIRDCEKTNEEIEDEGRILAEMLEIVEQRDALVCMLEEDRLRYKVEDEDLESSLLAKGYNLSPPSKS